MKSNNLNKVDSQLEIPLARVPNASELPLSVIIKQQSLMGAISLCITESGLDDKEVYIPLDIDAGHWTCIRKGTKHFPVNKLTQLMDECGNEIPLLWLAYRRGYECTPMISSIEQELLKAREEKSDLKKQVETLTNLLRR